MDKIHYLAYSANDAILNSAMDFDNVDLFGPMQVNKMTGIDLEITEVFGEQLEFERYYLCLHFNFILSFLTFLLFSVKIQMMMTQMTMKSV